MKIKYYLISASILVLLSGITVTAGPQNLEVKILSFEKSKMRLENTSTRIWQLEEFQIQKKQKDTEIFEAIGNPFPNYITVGPGKNYIFQVDHSPGIFRAVRTSNQTVCSEPFLSHVHGKIDCNSLLKTVSNEEPYYVTVWLKNQSEEPIKGKDFEVKFCSEAYKQSKNLDTCFNILMPQEEKKVQLKFNTSQLLGNTECEILLICKNILLEKVEPKIWVKKIVKEQSTMTDTMPNRVKAIEALREKKELIVQIPEGYYGKKDKRPEILVNLETIKNGPKIYSEEFIRSLNIKKESDKIYVSIPSGEYEKFNGKENPKILIEASKLEEAYVSENFISADSEQFQNDSDQWRIERTIHMDPNLEKKINFREPVFNIPKGTTKVLFKSAYFHNLSCYIDFSQIRCLGVEEASECPATMLIFLELKSSSNKPPIILPLYQYPETIPRKLNAHRIEISTFEIDLKRKVFDVFYNYYKKEGEIASRKINRIHLQRLKSLDINENYTVDIVFNATMHATDKKVKELSYIFDGLLEIL